MAQKIEKDVKRFKDIVRGHIKKDFKKYITNGGIIAGQGKDKISIPMPQIQLPKFRFGSKQKGGVGQGDGEISDQIGTEEEDGPGSGKAGDKPGDHPIEVEVELKELAEILGEELDLPNIEPKGKKTITSIKDRYSSIRRVGPESLRQFKKTYTNALKRLIASGGYNPDDPMIIPERCDKRYRSWKDIPKPESNAVIIYMMDISGSMREEQKELVRIMSFWIDTWIRSKYKMTENVYLVHDTDAKEVDQHTFYHAREAGGTKISSVYRLCHDIIKKKYEPSEWNIYPFHFTDGDNLSYEDNDLCVEILTKQLLPVINMFCYGQVKGEFQGTGNFLSYIENKMKNEDKVIATQIESKDQILPAIKKFLGKGK